MYALNGARAGNLGSLLWEPNDDIVDGQQDGWIPEEVFAPTDVPGCRLWLQGNLGLFDSTVGGSAVSADEAAVKRWEDQSGTGMHFIEATNAPTLELTSAGFVALEFTAASSHVLSLAHASAGALTTLQGASYTKVMLIRAKSATSGTRCWFGKGGLANNRFMFLTDDSTRRGFSRYASLNCGDTGDGETSQLVHNKTYVLTYTFNLTGANTGDEVLRINGQVCAKRSGAMSAVDTTNPWTICANTVGGVPANFFDGYVGMILMYDSVLGENDIAQVERYAATYGNVTFPEYEPGYRIITDGDSITYFGGVGGYTKEMKVVWGRDCLIQNVGIGGSSIGVTASLMVRDGNIDPITLITIFSKTNAINNGAQTGAEAYADLVSNVDDIRSIYGSAAKIGVATMLPRSSFDATKEQYRLDYNQAIRDGFADDSLDCDAVLDCGADPDLADPDDLQWYQDGTHPTLAGQIVIAEYFVQGMGPFLTPPETILPIRAGHGELSSGTITFPTTFLVESLLFYPTGTGRSTAWTAGTGTTFAEVDDGATPDDDTTYLQSTVANVRHSVKFANIPSPDIRNDDSILCVVFRARVRSVDTQHSIMLYIQTNEAGVFVDDVSNSVTTAWTDLEWVMYDDPITGLPWTVSTVREWFNSATAANQRHFGVRNNNASEDARWTQAELEVFVKVQPISPGHIASTAVVQGPTVLPAQTVSPGTIGSGNVVRNADVSVNQTVSPGHIASTSTVRNADLTVPILVSPGFISSATTVRNANLASNLPVAPGFIASGNVVRNANLTVPIQVSPGFLAAATVVHAPFASGGDIAITGFQVNVLPGRRHGDFSGKANTAPQTISPGFIASASTVRNANLTLGGIIVAPNFIPSASVVRSCSLSLVLTLSPGHIASTSTVRNANLSLTLTVSPGHISPTTTVRNANLALSLTVSPGFIASGSVVRNANLTMGAITVSPGHIAFTVTVRTAALSLSLSLLPGHIASTVVVRNANLDLDLTVAPNHIASTVIVRNANLDLDLTLLPGHIASTTVVRNATLTAGVLIVSPGHIASTAVVRTVVVNTGGIVAPDDIPSGSVVRSPVLTVPILCSPGFIASGNVVRNANLSLLLTVSTGFIASGSVVRNPALALRLTVSPGFIAGGSVVRNANLASVLTVQPNFLAAGSVVRSPALQLVLTVSPGTISSGNVVRNANLDLDLTVSPSFLANPTVVRAPQLFVPILCQPAFIAAGSVVYSVELRLGRLDGTFAAPIFGPQFVGLF